MIELSGPVTEPVAITVPKPPFTPPGLVEASLRIENWNVFPAGTGSWSEGLVDLDLDPLEVAQPDGGRGVLGHRDGLALAVRGHGAAPGSQLTQLACRTSQTQYVPPFSGRLDAREGHLTAAVGDAAEVAGGERAALVLVEEQRPATEHRSRRQGCR